MSNSTILSGLNSLIYLPYNLRFRHCPWRIMMSRQQSKQTNGGEILIKEWKEYLWTLLRPMWTWKKPASLPGTDFFAKQQILLKMYVIFYSQYYYISFVCKMGRRKMWNLRCKQSEIAIAILWLKLLSIVELRWISLKSSRLILERCLPV